MLLNGVSEYLSCVIENSDSDVSLEAKTTPPSPLISDIRLSSSLDTESFALDEDQDQDQTQSSREQLLGSSFDLGELEDSEDGMEFDQGEDGQEEAEAPAPSSVRFDRGEDEDEPNPFDITDPVDPVPSRRRARSNRPPPLPVRDLRDSQLTALLFQPNHPRTFESESDLVPPTKSEADAPKFKLMRFLKVVTTPSTPTRSRSNNRAFGTSSTEWLAPFRYSTFVDIGEDNICTVHNIRNLSFDEWMRCSTLPTPPISPYHENAQYDVTLLKDIWIGFSPQNLWMTFSFYPKPDDTVGRADINALKSNVTVREAAPYVDREYRSIDNYDYLCLSIEHKQSVDTASTSRYQLSYSFCTMRDMINKCRASPDYPFNLSLFPILERASTEKEAFTRRKNAQSFLLNTFKRTNAAWSEAVEYDSLTNGCLSNLIDLGRESGEKSPFDRTLG